MNSQDRGDFVIAIAVFLQSFLIIFQHVLISCFFFNEDSTTVYRVAMSALVMLIALSITLKREPKVFISTYLIVFSILIINYIVFPDNTEYLKTNSIKFILPFIVGNALCLKAVNNIIIAERALYYISWATFFLVVLYSAFYLLGGFTIESYSMSFSYGCLLPMIGLYRHRKLPSYIAAVLLFIIVLAIGSRGAAVVFLAYFLYDILQSQKNGIIILIAFILIFAYLLLPVLGDYLSMIGINSRTLSLLLAGEISQDSGRSALYQEALQIIEENPLGIGLFGDRVHLDGAYCHNIILEMAVNWGYVGVLIIGSIILFVLIITYLKSDRTNRNRIICYSLVLIGPLMVSHSYLTDPNFGIYCGMIMLIYKQNSYCRTILHSVPLK